MLSKAKLAFVGALAILAHAAFAAGSAAPQSADTGLPKTNIESACRDAQWAAPPELRSDSYDSCIHDERLAFEQLRQSWAKYPAEARETCAEPSYGVPFSYVELQTCLEMQPGGSLTVEGQAPDGLGPPDSTALPALQPTDSLTVQSPAPNGLHSFDSMAPPAP
jgi:hypothetical protein